MVTRVVGVDIGSDSIRAVEIQDPSKAKPTLLRHHQVPLPDGAVSRGEVIEQNTVAAALKLLWKTGGFTSKRVVLGVGNQRVFARELTVPKAPLRHIRESLPFLVQEMLPVPVAEALLDFYPIAESEGEHGPVVRGLLVAAVKEAVAGNVNAARLAGLTVENVDLIPFALSRVLVTRHAIPGGVVLVDVGADTTSVVMAVDGVPQFVRIIPAGGGDVTRTLQSSLEVPEVEAEIAKRRLGLAQSAEHAEASAAEVIYRVTGELLNSLRNTVSFFTNTRPDQAISQIVLTGGGSMLHGFRENLTRMTGLPVNPADPLKTISVSPKVNSDDLRLQQISLATALGLAIGSTS